MSYTETPPNTENTGNSGVETVAGASQGPLQGPLQPPATPPNAAANPPPQITPSNSANQTVLQIDPAIRNEILQLIQQGPYCKANAGDHGAKA